MIVAVTATLNEADIIGDTVAHLFAEGVDRVLVNDGMSADGTREILAAFPDVTVVDDDCPFFRQDEIMTDLARQAHELGAGWVIPFDADEFWYSDLGPLGEVLPGVDAAVGVLPARMFAHRDRVHREVDPKPLPKVAFRAGPDVIVAKGNHAVANVPGETRHEVVDLREIQFRSYAHFVRKVRERYATLNPSWVESEGSHYREWGVMSDAELSVAWDRFIAAETIVDPIPTR